MERPFEHSNIEEYDGFTESLTFMLGEGRKVSFWTGRWIGQRPLCRVFPLLFQEAENKTTCVQDMGWWSENSWNWKLENSRYALNAEVAAEEEELQHIFTEVAPKRFFPDGFSWPMGGEGVYEVSDYYRKL